MTEQTKVETINITAYLQPHKYKQSTGLSTPTSV